MSTIHNLRANGDYVCETGDRRSRVLAEARSWLRTPFRHGVSIKGVGADCSTFIAAVMRAAGIFDAQGIPSFSPQWFLHHNDEHYLEHLRKYAREVAEGGSATSQPGDIAVVKRGRVYAHGAIVLSWPQVIHCYPPHGVQISDVRYSLPFRSGDFKFFNPFPSS